MKIRIKSILYFSITLLLCQHTFAAEDPDDLLKKSLEFAEKKDYKTADDYADKAYSIDTTRADIIIFKANLKAWQHEKDSAIYYIEKAYQKNPSQDYLYDSWLNILLWNKLYDRIPDIVKVASENKYKNEYNLFVKSLEAYRGLGKYKEALELIKTKENTSFMDSTLVSSIRNEINTLSRKTTVSAGYSFDYANTGNNKVQQLAFMEYSTKIKSTIALLRLNYARRFAQNGLQIESDVYSLFKNRSYLYLNAGYGFNSNVFPVLRGGFEYTYPVFKTVEATLGGRYMKFQNLPVYMLTGQLLKYHNSWTYALRSFYTIKNNGNASTFLFDIRKYGKKTGDFNELELGYGNTPDERLFIENNGAYFGLDAYKVRLTTNKMINLSNEIRLSVNYNLEEYSSGSFRNRFILDIIYRFRMQ